MSDNQQDFGTQLVQYQQINAGQTQGDESSSHNDDKLNFHEDIRDDQRILIQETDDNPGLFQQFKRKWRNFLHILNENSIKIFAGVSIFLSIAVLIMYNSLKQKCPFDSDHRCLKEFIFPNLAKWVSIVAFNSLATIIQLHLLIEGSTHRWIPAYGFIQSIYLFVFDDNIINLHYYMGGINAIHQIITVVILVCYGILRAWIKCFRASKPICFFGNILVITLILFTFYNKSIVHGCDYWTKGINGEIENSDGMCKVTIPTICWYKVTHYWQDVSLLLPTCENSSTSSAAKDSISKFFKPFTGDQRYIGFANLNTFDEDQRTDDSIQFTVFSSSKGYSSLEQAQNEKNDVVFDREEMKYNIDVQFNQTLSEERIKQVANQTEEKPIAKNVLLIFIDAVSRQSMHLKMPKTVEWFEKRAQYQSYKQSKMQSEEEKKSSQSFEFYKYNSLKSFTFDNLMNLIYGQKVRGKKLSEEKKLVSIIEEYKNRGFVTGHSSDQCQTLSLGFDKETINIVKSSRYDHETQSYACDPNFQDPESTFGLFQGPYSIVRRCLYGRAMAEYPLEYAKSFFKKYENNQKFMHLEFSYGHEGTGEVINHLDDPLSHFLEEMSDSDLLKDTTVILFSDHGLHMQGIFYLLNLENVFIEINLPGLFINLPPEVNEKYGDSISKNQQNIVSIINLHHFMKHLMIGDSYQNITKSLMSPLDYQKNCLSVGVEDNFCSCK